MMEQIEHEQVVSAPRTDLVLAKTFVGNFQPGDTTPSVKNVTVFKAINIAPVTITNFVGGQSGQAISVLGDGMTTLTHGIFITCNTGANKLLLVGKIYRFTLIGAMWYEDE
jgi:hypothetical protein